MSVALVPRPAATLTPVEAAVRGTANPGWSRRRRTRAAIGWAAAACCALHLAAFAFLEYARPDLRDPEYGRRLVALRQRVAEHPGRPLVVVIGSSRAAMAVCPRAWEESRPGGTADPLLFNMARVGGGPLMNLMTLRRLYADGVRPAAVVLEYWPPLLREEGAFRETDRIDADKLYWTDTPFLRGYHPDPEGVERAMWSVRWNPVSSARVAVLRGVAPYWLPREKRVNGAVDPLDGWGWLPGHDAAGVRLHSRESRLARCEGIYRIQLAGLEVDPAADRATREAVALARANGALPVFAWLPESSEFRGWFTPAAEGLGQDYLRRLRRELNIPLIDGRGWLADESLADGFHATRAGSEEFSRSFGPGVRDLLRSSSHGH